VNGAGMDTLVDTVVGNNAIQTSSSNRPIYTTSAINGLAALAFDGTTSEKQMAMLGTPTFAPPEAYTGSLTYYAVVEPGAISGVYGYTIFGPSTQINTLHGISWAIFNGKQFLYSSNITSIGIGTVTLSTSTFSVIAVTYNMVSGAWTMYECSGGTCTVDNSGTTTTPSTTTQTDDLGSSPSDGFYYNGLVAEYGYLDSASIAGIATYVQCQYNI
jgi:hypothetical protein